MLTKDDIAILTQPFPHETLGIKIQALSKDKTKAMLICYLQHTDVMGRLDKIDPCWYNQKISLTGEKTDAGMWFICEMTLTLKGVTRINIGEGNTEKAAYSDALKRCAMLFGVGRYLYDSDQAWVPYNEQTMKHKQWTYEEYQVALKSQTEFKPITRPVIAYQQQPANPIVDLNIPLNPETFIFNFGKYKGKRVGDMPFEELVSYALYIEEKASQEQKALSGQVKQFVGWVKKF